LNFVLDALDLSPDEPSVLPSLSELQLTGNGLLVVAWCIVLRNDDKHAYDEV
ncbi:hypothetical protein C8R43DRAFT_848220, partial [Mycena crocata]